MLSRRPRNGNQQFKPSILDAFLAPPVHPEQDWNDAGGLSAQAELSRIDAG